MKENREKKKKLIYLVVFFSVIIFIASLYFIKYELNLTNNNNPTTNLNWQQFKEDFNQISDSFKENIQEFSNLNTETDNSTPTVLTNEEIELLKEKVENTNINNINENTNL